MERLNRAAKKTPPHTAFFARIQGRVQGVGFRYSAWHEARRIGLTGWIRNTSGGDVEIWAEGPEEKLTAFLLWLHRGPPGARVESVHQDPRHPRGIYNSFSIEY
jgi:acylphosphatase